MNRPNTNRCPVAKGLWLSSILVWIFACGGPVDGHHGGGAGLAWALAHNPEVQVQVTRAEWADDEWLQHSMDRWRSEMGLQVELLNPGVHASSAKSRVVIGCAGDAEVDALLDHLGVIRGENRWEYGGLSAKKEQAWLVATFKDPQGNGMPVTLLAAQDSKWLQAGLRKLQPGTFPMLRMYGRGFPVVEAQLNSLGKIRRDRWVDCRPWHAQAKGVNPRETQRLRGWRVISSGEVPNGEIDDYAEAMVETLGGLSAWSGMASPQSPQLYVQGSAHQWRFGEAPGGWAQVDPTDRTVQVLLGSGSLGDAGARAGQVFLESHLGPASLPWLAEAAGLQASEHYWGHSITDWWSRIARLGELPTPAELVSGDGLEGASPHLIGPLRALLVQVVIDQDPDQLMRLWKEGESSSDWKPWFAAFAKRLGSLAAQPQPGSPMKSIQGEAHAFGVSLQGGMDAQGPGLASKAMSERVQALQAGQASALAFNLSLVSEPHSPLVRTRALRTDRRMGDVRGESLLFASIAQARSPQIRIGLELEMWATPSGVLLQDMIWPSRAKVEEFFEAYNRGALHAALFAQLAGVDLLCLGDGMGEIIRTNPRESELQDSVRLEILSYRSELWKRLIDTIRPAFQGGLTLAVSSWRGVEHSDVWSKLGVISADLWIPRRTILQSAKGAKATMESHLNRELAGFRQACGDKPGVIWALGFEPSVRPGQAGDLPGFGGQTVQEDWAWAGLGRGIRRAGDLAPPLIFMDGVSLQGENSGLGTPFSGVLKALGAFSGVE